MSTSGVQPLLEVRGLRSGYGRIQILDGTELTVGRGQVVGILGHNGMGKTTLLRTLIGHLKASGGSILLEGKALGPLRTHERVRLGLGYVPQGREIFPELTALENLRMGMPQSSDEKVLEEVLSFFPALPPLLDRPGRGLSGGQQQILALARCLVGRPKLMMLDEPTEGIQPSIVDEIAERLLMLKKQLNLSVLLVEQDLHFISSVADTVLIIQKGRIVAQMRPEELADRRVVAKYLGI